MVCMLARRSDEMRFPESPASVLRKSPVRVASQMSPLLSTATELMANSGPRGFDGSQLSPPLTETATMLLPAIATTLPATLMLTGTPTPGIDSCRQLSPESELISRALEVAANHLGPAISRTLTRAASSFAAAAWLGPFLADATSALPARRLRGIHLAAFNRSEKMP